MTRETLFMKAINEGLDQAMERDERVVLLGEDISGGVNVEHLENNNEDAWGGVMGITRRIDAGNMAGNVLLILRFLSTAIYQLRWGWRLRD